MLVTDIADEILSCKVSIKFPTCPKMISESILTSPTWRHLKFLCSISAQVERPQITRSTSWSSKINQNDRRVVVNDSITTHVLLFSIYWSLISLECCTISGESYHRYFQAFSSILDCTYRIPAFEYIIGSSKYAFGMLINVSSRVYIFKIREIYLDIILLY